MLLTGSKLTIAATCVASVHALLHSGSRPPLPPSGSISTFSSGISPPTGMPPQGTGLAEVSEALDFSGIPPSLSGAPPSGTPPSMSPPFGLPHEASLIKREESSPTVKPASIEVPPSGGKPSGLPRSPGSFTHERPSGTGPPSGLPFGTGFPVSLDMPDPPSESSPFSGMPTELPSEQLAERQEPSAQGSHTGPRPSGEGTAHPSGSEPLHQSGGSAHPSGGFGRGHTGHDGKGNDFSKQGVPKGGPSGFATSTISNA